MSNLANDILACQFSSWYPIFRKISIKSAIIELPSEFVDYLCEDGIRLPEAQSEIFGTDTLSDDDSLQTVSEDQDTGEVVAFDFTNISNTITDKIREIGGQGVFVKLNWSAALDASWINTGTLRCTSSSEVFLLLKASDRISFDINNIFDFAPTNSAVRYTLILRRWIDIHPAMEFRVFVLDDKIVGICQRDCTSYYAFLAGRISAIQSTISTFYESSIYKKFHLSNFIVDVYLDERNPCIVKIVDFNPFGDPTSPLLFEWEDFLAVGDKPSPCLGIIAFRIVESQAETMKSTKGQSRGPIDVALAPDFHRFFDLCKKQAEEDVQDA